MKIEFCVIALIVFVCNLNAQLRSTVTTSNGNTRPSSQSVNPCLNKLTLKVSPNVDCEIIIDGESVGIVKAGLIKRIYLSKGEFSIKAKGNDGNIIFSDKKKVVAGDLNNEEIYEVNSQAFSNPSSKKVGYVNSNNILLSMPETKILQEAVANKKAYYQKIEDDKYAEYDKKVKEIKDRGNNAQSVLDSKVKEINDLAQEITDFAKEAQGNLQKYSDEQCKPLQAKFENAKKEIIKEQGLSSIVDLAEKGTMFDPQNGLDVTAAFRAKLSH